MPDRPVPNEDGYLELEEDELSAEQLDTQVQKAQEQLLALKRQQDQIEKQKRELEELSRRQDQLQQGRAEMIEKLTRALVIVERETLDAEKRVDLLKTIEASYQQHLQYLESINPRSWEPSEINRELSKALSAVDDARTEYAKSRSKISPEATESGAEGEAYTMEYDSIADRPFLYWLKSGLAFTLPLIIVLVLLAIIIIALSAPVS